MEKGETNTTASFKEKPRSLKKKEEDFTIYAAASNLIMLRCKIPGCDTIRQFLSTIFSSKLPRNSIFHKFIE